MEAREAATIIVKAMLETQSIKRSEYPDAKTYAECIAQAYQTVLEATSKE